MKLIIAAAFLAFVMVQAGFQAAAQQSNNPPAAAAAPAQPRVAQTPPADYTNSIGMSLLRIPGLGWAGKFEVTQKEFQEVTGSNPSAFPGELHPVDNVSWDEAVEFCRKLTDHEIQAKELPAGFRYTLPTEAQWETLAGDARLNDAVTSSGATRSGTAAVGSLGPNNLGLYDTRGNIMEFCLPDPARPATRVLRGGSWQDGIEVNLRTEFRHYCRPDERQNTFGFRCILVGP